MFIHFHQTKNIEYSFPGSRLFSIYVNDFSESVAKGEVNLYADGTTAYVIGNSHDKVVAKLNLLFEEIHTWCGLKKTHWKV